MVCDGQRLDRLPIATLCPGHEVSVHPASLGLDGLGLGPADSLEWTVSYRFVMDRAGDMAYLV